MYVLTQRAGFGAGGSRIVFVGSVTGNYVGSGVTSLDLTALTGGIASTAIAGDLVIFVGGYADASTDHNLAMATADYNEVADLHAIDTTDCGLGVFWKLMGGTPDTTVQMSNTDGTTDMTGIAYVLRGVNQSSPIDTTTQTATGTSSVLADPPSITPVTAGALILAVGAGGHTAGEQTFTNAALSNLVNASRDGSNDSTIAIGRIPWPGGAYNPAAFGFSTSDNVAYSWCAATLAIRPG